ncbi:addiction module antitoxin [Orrella sp. 11846]|uniref:addiction module antitoxin n=1 Tax=Orrella sp. 11846 TaxID=3409913 RepID=UPI003B599E2B
MNDKFGDFVDIRLGESGIVNNVGKLVVSKPICDLSRQGSVSTEQQLFKLLKTELRRAYEAPEAAYQSLTAAEIIARNQI